MNTTPISRIKSVVLVAALACLGVAVSVGVQSCKTVGTPVLQKVERTVDCLKDRIPAQAIGYLDVVTTCLADRDYMGCLVPLAEKAGRDVVACAVAQVGSEATVRAGRAGPGALPNQDQISKNAKAYLEADGARAVIR